METATFNEVFNTAFGTMMKYAEKYIFGISKHKNNLKKLALESITKEDFEENLDLASMENIFEKVFAIPIHYAEQNGLQSNKIAYFKKVYHGLN